MELTFNQIEAVFTHRFDISADHAVAFRGRLQHLQRLNFPTGVNTGRGKKASYGWTQIIQLMVALDLMDLGLTPDVAAKSVRKNTDKLIDAVYEVTREFGQADAMVKALKKARCPFGMTRIAIASTLAFTFPSHEEESPAIIQTFTGPEFTRRLTDDPAVEPTYAYIDVGSRLMAVAQLVGRIGSHEPLVVATSLFEWAFACVAPETLS